MTGFGLAFAPLFPLPVLAGLAALALALALFALWSGSRGWWLRTLAFAALLLGMAEPSLREEVRDPLADVAFLVIDESASQEIGERAATTAATEAAIAERLEAFAAARPGESPVETRVVRLRPAPGVEEDAGTRLLGALADAAAEVAPERIAGAIVISDGQVHDPEALAAFPAPVHLLLTGEEGEWDLRLRLDTAPAFGIVGEEVAIRLTVAALGPVPAEAAGRPEVLIRIDGAPWGRVAVALGQTVETRIPIAHGGPNIVELVLPVSEGELTDRNNAAVIAINGVRDRLRVLLISGEPHPGERTWRNLLKSDPSVDLVHFTILRPPEKQDAVPVLELSLIAFPTRELFLDKIDEFDLIVFDRYQRRGVLTRPMFENIARYVREGGAVLVAAGPDYAGPDSLHLSAVRDVLPVEPTKRIVERGFRPVVTPLGFRHPVTEALEGAGDAEAPPVWGRWFRLVDVVAGSGHVVMEGPEARPLLILDRPEEGRVAVLASDHAWLWARGFEGGGPQAELLRRLAHWLMKEPDLEEEALVATVKGSRVAVMRRSLEDWTGTLTVTAPSGGTETVAMDLRTPGRWSAEFLAGEQGLWKIADGTRTVAVAVGPAAPREFENPISTHEVLAPLVEASLGGALRLAAAGVPDIRRVREGRLAAGRGWIALTERRAFLVRDIRLTPLAPGWLMLVLASLLLIAAWRIEAR